MLTETWSVFAVSIIRAFGVKSNELTNGLSHPTGGPLLLLLHFLTFELTHC